ncbi:connectin [Dermacentor silvarum]|uniref:connectin n=1 Tax=Dermacentor silvarum TaxID=543639 RepID=UPI00189A3F9F|nr:connectin [Dermacentor silvarum]
MSGTDAAPLSGAAHCRRTLSPSRDAVASRRRPAGQTTRRDPPFLFPAMMLLSVYVIASTCSLPFVACTDSSELVPNLCRLMDQPMYCRCDSEDITDDATDVSCFITRPLTADHAVFKSFQNHLSLTSLSFNAFNLDNKLTFVPSEALRQCSQLERLKFTQSELGVLKTRSFYNLSRLAWLSLDSNAITDLENESIAQMPRLKRLELGDNKLSRIPAGSLRALPALTQLFLERNEIKAIEDLAFEELTSVKEVDLSDNAVENLTDRTFKGLSSAIRLDLFRNKIQRLEARVFSGMPQLVELDLKYNGVTEVDPLAFDGLPQLSILYLSHNRLRILPAQMFMGAPNLITVDLSQNQLLTLTWRTVQDLRKIDSESFDMSLTGNKFGCDCRLAWILHLEKATRNEKFRRELRHVKCNFEQTPAPGNLSSGTKVARLSLKDLGCPENYAPPELPSSLRDKKMPLSAFAGKSGANSAHGKQGSTDDNGSNKIVERPPQSPLDESHHRGPGAGDGKDVENDVEVALSQQKAAPSEAVLRRNRDRHSAASWVHSDKTVSWLLICVTLALVERSR